MVEYGITLEAVRFEVEQIFHDEEEEKDHRVDIVARHVWALMPQTIRTKTLAELYILHRIKERRDTTA